MTDKGKTREELTAELEKLRQKVTALEASEAKRKRAEENYRNIVKLAPDGIVTINAKGVLTSCNTAFSQLTGFPKEEFIGKHFTKVPTMRMKDTPKYLQLFTSMLRGKEFKTFELKWIHKDGTERIGEFHYGLMRSGAKITGIQVIARDITERKKVDQRIAFLAEILEHAPFSVIATDEQGNITHINHATERMFGYTRRELIGKNPNMFNAEPNAEEIQKDIMDTVGRGKVWRGEMLNRRKDGELFYIGASIYRLLDTEGNMIALVGFQRDITKRKQAEEALKESEANYRTLVEQSLQGLVVVQDFQIVFANAAFAEISGYTIKELLSLTPQEVQRLIHQEDQALVWGRFRDRLTGKKVPPRYEYRGIRKDGELRWLEMVASRIEYRGKPAIQGAVIDITERKQAEGEMAKFKAAIDNFGYGVAIGHPEKLTYINRAFAEMHGYSPDELVGQNYSVLYTDEQLPVIDRLRAQLFKTGSFTNQEVWHKRKDGTVFPTLMAGSLLRDEKGNPSSIAGTVVDITERKRMEEALRESEEQYRALVEAGERIGEAIIVVQDTDRTKAAHVFASPEWARMTGYSVEELKEISYYDLIHPRYLDAVADRVQRRLRGEDIPGRHEIAIVTRDGREVPVEVSASPTLYTGKSSAVGYIRDITERKKSEEALRASEERLALLYEEAPVGYHELDREGRIIQVNRTELEMLGYTAEEMLGRHVWDFMVEKETSSKAFAAKMAGTMLPGQAFERTYCRKDGTTFPTLLEDRPVRDESGQITGLRSTIQDITERKQAEQALQESEERYRALVNLGAETGEAVVMLQDDERGVGMHVFASEAWARITGYSVAELLNISMADLIHPRDRAAAVSRHDRRMQGDELPGLYEISIIRKDGTEVPVEVTYAFSNYRGKRANVGYIRDITRRRQAEEALQLRAHLLNSATDSIMAADLEGNIIYANDTACHARGYTKEEMLEMHLRDTVPPELQSLVPRRIQKIIEEGYASFESEHRRKDGSTFPVEINTRTVKLGESTIMLSAMRDITERKKAEAALRESEEFNSTVLHNSPNPVLVANPDTSIRYVNPALEELTGYSLDEIIGQKLPRPWWPEEFLEKIEHDAKIAYRSGFKSLEHCFKKKNGERFWVQITATPVFIDGEFRQFIDNWVDITERKHMEEEIVRSRDYLDRLTNSLTDMVFDIKLPERTFQYINKTVETVLGYSQEECIGQSIEMLYPGHKVFLELGRRLRRGIERGDEITTSEHELKTKDGRIITVEGRTSYQRENGEVVAALSVVRDITERKKTEVALKESEEKYRLLVENQTDLLVKVNTEGEFQFVSPSYCEMFGINEDRLLSRKFMPLVHEDDRETTARAMESLYKPPHTCFVEQRALTKHGWRWLAWSDKAVLDEHNNVVSIVGVGRDITERKSAEEEYQTIVRTTMDGFWLVDMQGHFLDVNDAYCQLIGYSHDELLNMSIPDIEAVEKPEETAQHIQKIKDTGHDRFETRHRCKDGEIVEVEVSVNYMPTDEGQMFVFIRNITERKQAEEQLKSEKDKLQTMMSGLARSGIGIDIIGRDYRVRFQNEALQDSFGDAIGKLCYETYLARKKPCDFCPMVEAIKTKKIESVELTGVNGRDYEILSAPLPNPDGTIDQAIEVVRDITERKKLEEEHERATKLESLGTLAGGIAHDFNNLLTGILGNISLARRYVEADSKASERLGEAEKASIRARDLTQQLLTFSRGGAPIKKSVSIGKLLADATRFALRGTNIRPEFSFAPRIRPVDIDEGQINQVLTNLIINACEAMPQGGILQVGARNLLAREVRSLKLTPGQYIEVTVSDQGVGIPPEHVDRIFEPYFTTKPKGSGLGLATVYSIIRNHDGHITVESEVDKGTTFHIYLPAAKEPEAKTTDIPADVPIAGRGRILVMDDEDIIREFLYHELTDVGYEVTVTSDGAEAVRKHKKAKNEKVPFDAVILDLTVSGGMGGKEAIKQLRAIDPKVRAIASSGYANDPIMANHRKYGFRAVVAKPYRVEELEKTLQGVLNPKR